MPITEKFSDLLNTPLWKLTGEEFIELLDSKIQMAHQDSLKQVPLCDDKDKLNGSFVYGLLGLSRFLGISQTTAWKLVKSGKIDSAVTRVGKKIIVNGPLAMELLRHKKQGKR